MIENIGRFLIGLSTLFFIWQIYKIRIQILSRYQRFQKPLYWIEIVGLIYAVSRFVSSVMEYFGWNTIWIGITATVLFFLISGLVLKHRRQTIIAQWNSVHETDDTNLLPEAIQTVEQAKQIIEAEIKNQ